MEEHLLDEDLLLSHESPKDPQPYRWIALLILWVGFVLNTLSLAFLYSKIFAGTILLIIVSWMSYKNLNLGSKLTYAILLAGTLCAVQYFPFLYYYEFHINGFTINIDVVLLFILFIHLLTNMPILYPFWSTIFGNDAAESDVNKQSRSKVAGFKKRFARRTPEQLKSILSNERLIPEARQAAKELISESQLDH